MGLNPIKATPNLMLPPKSSRVATAGSRNNPSARNHSVPRKFQRAMVS